MKVITFGSGTTGAGGLGSGKSPMKRRIVVHIARAAYITLQHITSVIAIHFSLPDDHTHFAVAVVVVLMVF